MIFGYGVFEWTTGSYPAGVQLTDLHTPVWWGGVLTCWVFYVVKFRPGAQQWRGICDRVLASARSNRVQE